MTVIKRRQNGTVEIIEDTAFIEVREGESVFSEATRAAAVDVIPEWQQGKGYSIDDVVSHDGKLYRVLSAHTSRLDRVPTVARNLFADIWTRE